ncbi:hypothetical protein CPC08DRAFT_723497 [Agrocybe pediades]|nr:hypothetical protein CPC08DRAFT_723497 [Agrocybe pediades]
MFDIGFQYLPEHSLPFLEILDITLDRVDKELLRSFSKSGLPHTLTTLNLDLSPASSHACYQLLASELGFIAEIFPNLQRLDVPLFMDMSELRLKEMRRFVRSSSARPLVKPNSHPLHRLHIKPSYFSADNGGRHMMPASQHNAETAYVFARYLHHVFPCLRQPYIQCPRPDTGDYVWQNIVYSLMNQFFEEESSGDESGAKD